MFIFGQARMNKPGLETQSSGRELTSAETTLANALEAIYTDGVSDYAAVAARLASDGIARPSGETAPWTEAALLDELTKVNASLDKAYGDNGRGA
jgi:hypothetical protein